MTKDGIVTPHEGMYCCDSMGKISWGRGWELGGREFQTIQNCTIKLKI